MIELVRHLAQQGYHVDTVVPDGKVHRFALDKDDHKKSAYYIAYQNYSQDSGEQFYVMVYGSWSSGVQETFCTFNKKMSATEKAAMKKKTDEAKRKAEAERSANQEATALEVQEKLKTLSRTGVSEYLKRKQIAECPDLGIYFEFGGSFYVPMQDVDGKIWSCQKIQWDGGKFFYPLGRVSGCFHVLGDLASAGVLYIAEGFATAASVRLATNQAVVCAFNAGNLEAVCREIKARYSDKQIVVCGDDDQWATRPDGSKWNPGREKGEAAAKICFGKIYFPQFENLDGKPTDFNDLHVREGLAKVAEQLKEKVTDEAERLYLHTLGFSRGEYYFTSSQNRQIINVSRFTESEMLNMMPIEYWEIAYPGSGASRVNWTDAKSRMMEQARKQGLFDCKRIRGAGVWNDDGRIVVHMGDHLLVDGVATSLGRIKSRYFYTLSRKINPLHPNPLNLEESELLLKTCENFKWQKAEFGPLLAGWLVIARVCGALPVRPHLWVTGESQSGKSTLMEQLIQPMISTEYYFNGKTTEAGIRQAIDANAAPVQFDEFETSDQGDRQKVQAVLDLMRVAWSESASFIVKGGSGGTATYYQARFSALVSSIRPGLQTDADKSRFTQIELAPHNSDEAHWEMLSALLAKITPDYSDRMFARTIQMVPTLLSNFKTIKKALSGRSGQRFGDQYGMLMAGLSLLVSDAPVTEDEAKNIIDILPLTDEREAGKVKDQADCLDHLLTKVVQLEKNGERHAFAVHEAIHSALLDADVNAALQRIGIRVASDFVSIMCKNSELESQVFRGTRWTNNWADALSRLPQATRKNVRFSLVQDVKKAIEIPLSLFKK